MTAKSVAKKQKAVKLAPPSRPRFFADARVRAAIKRAKQELGGFKRNRSRYDVILEHVGERGCRASIFGAPEEMSVTAEPFSDRPDEARVWVTATHDGERLLEPRIVTFGYKFYDDRTMLLLDIVERLEDGRDEDDEDDEDEKYAGGPRPKSGGRELEGVEWNGFPLHVVPEGILEQLSAENPR